MSEERVVEPLDEIDSILVGGEEASKIYCGWFVPGHDQDFMATTILSAKDGKYKCISRFRYHGGPGAWDKRDEKHWFVASSDSIDKLNAATDHAVETLVRAGYGGPVEKIDAGGDINLYMRLLREKDFTSCRSVPAPEPEPKN